MGGSCSTNGNVRNAYNIFIGNSERDRPVGRPRRICEDNIRLDLREMGGLDASGSG